MREKQESSPETLSDSDRSRVEIEARIRVLRHQARKGGWGLLLFVVISVLAIPGFNAFPALPQKVRQILGAPPKLEWISMALAVYVFSALTLTLGRIMQGSGAYRGWSHLFYISSFYIFYGFAGGMRNSFWAVFVSGLIILGLENYAIRTHSNEVIEAEKERLEKISESAESGVRRPEERN